MKSSSGEYSTGSVHATTQYDSLPPFLIKFVSATASPSNVVPISIIAEFSEAVTGLTQGQITVSSGFVSKITKSSQSKYIIEINPSSSSVTVSVQIERFKPSYILRDLSLTKNSL